jgi:hypothetical protein
MELEFDVCAVMWSDLIIYMLCCEFDYIYVVLCCEFDYCNFYFIFLLKINYKSGSRTILTNGNNRGGWNTSRPYYSGH